MPRDKIVIENNEPSEEELERIWQERVEMAKTAVKEAKMFVKRHKLTEQGVLFLAALQQELDNILSRRV